MVQIQIAADLTEIADGLREREPEFAKAIDAKRDELLEQLPPLTTDVAGELLGTTRPTIHEWVKRGVLDRHGDSSSRRVLITAESVAGVLPYIHEWHKRGSTKGALAAILSRFEDQADNEALSRVAAAKSSSGKPVLSGGFGHITIRKTRQRKR